MTMLKQLGKRSQSTRLTRWARLKRKRLPLLPLQQLLPIIMIMLIIALIYCWHTICQIIVHVSLYLISTATLKARVTVRKMRFGVKLLA